MCASVNDKFPFYSLKLWGITSSDGPDGYKAWGGPPSTKHPAIDGTVVPCAPAGSMPFAPEVCAETLTYARQTFGEKVWKRYGFVDAFNPQTDWQSEYVLGIDVGISLLMIENARDGFIWKYFMRNKYADNAMRKSGFVNTGRKMSKNDIVYLERLARDTWLSIDSMVNDKTGLPYDNSDKRPCTSVSNIGVYLSDIVAAEKFGFIDRAAAMKRLSLTLGSLEKLHTEFGFQQSWNNVETLVPCTNDIWISILDSGNLAGGLITVGQAFPELNGRCVKLVKAMDWAAFYNQEKKYLYGGYNMRTGKFNRKWTLPYLGSDSRMASFMAVACEKVPVESWSRLSRRLEERHHSYYLLPGWKNGGGLFEQYLPGIWLNEKGTFIGQSAANFTYAQIRQVQLGNYPAWGWSACNSPQDGYLGMGALKDNIVAPYASVLAIDDYPQAVIQNLYALEKLGARSKKYGFVDTVDIFNRKTSANYLMLDQSMIFLSLSNFLQDNVIRKLFGASPIVRHGEDVIRDYQRRPYNRNNSLCVLKWQ